jgi:hypothetical protein
MTWDFDPGTSDNCIAHAKGRGVYADYYVYDLVAITWGKDAWFMRDCLKPGAKRFEVEFPYGFEGKGRRRYTTLAAAMRAVENDAA